MSEEIREFDYGEEMKRRQKRCVACTAKIREGYAYYDRFSFVYCRDCFVSYKDLGSALRGWEEHD